jgi:hypothetical protein
MVGQLTALLSLHILDIIMDGILRQRVLGPLVPRNCPDVRPTESQNTEQPKRTGITILGMTNITIKRTSTIIRLRRRNMVMADYLASSTATRIKNMRSRRQNPPTTAQQQAWEQPESVPLQHFMIEMTVLTNFIRTLLRKFWPRLRLKRLVKEILLPLKVTTDS